MSLDPALVAALRSWSFEPWLAGSLLTSAVLYARGWLILRKSNPRRFGAIQLVCYIAGLSLLFVALASPIDAFADMLLSVHMVQHVLLTMVVPPLIWLGSPMIPLVRGAPVAIQKNILGPVLRSHMIRQAFRFFTRPLVSWLVFVLSIWIWHEPRLYELALRSRDWHKFEHTTFLATSLLFWRVIVRPYPMREVSPGWLLVPYLLLADVQNTVFSAIFCFSTTVLYPHYLAMPQLGGRSPLDDQATAGLIMWIPGSLAFLGPMLGIVLSLLKGPGDPVDIPRRPVSRSKPPQAWDALRLPILGQFLRWRHVRLTMQIPMFTLAVAIVVDGLRGPQISPMNLAGVLPWTHWRGLSVIALLAAGNVFCMGCPFLLPRTLSRKFLPAKLHWPRRLRTKWLSVVLLIAYLVAYESFSLWDSPRATAWLILGYFAGAFCVDGLFKGASFCKYVCPIGQFHFVQSMVSPLELKVINPSVCSACATKDCIRGRDGISGCELELFLPAKVGNLDCTFCLDCIHACPVENVGMLARSPIAEIASDERRSGIGRLSARPDFAAMALVIVFGAYSNAAGMTGPVLEFRDRCARNLGLENPSAIVAASILVEIVLIPLLVVGLTNAPARRWSGDRRSWMESACAFSFALVPLGAVMWVDHFAFHLATGWRTAFPVVHRVLSDMGYGIGRQIDWACGCDTSMIEPMLKVEIVLLGFGLLGSLLAGHRIARARFPRAIDGLKSLAPWGFVMVVLYALGVWILLQPMQMRGTMMAGG